MPKKVKTNTKGTTKTLTPEEEALIEIKNIGEAATKVNETLNYVNEYKRQGLQPNANDVMNLYKVVSDYSKKIHSYLNDPGKTTGVNNGAQCADLAGKYADARMNIRMIANVISKSMEEVKLDAKKYKNQLAETLTDKELKGKEGKELLAALTNYQSLDNGLEIPEGRRPDRANAKQRLMDACIGFVKNSKNDEAKTIIYDMAAIMGKQSIIAFDKLKDKDLSEMSTRRHLGYRTDAVGDYKAHYIENKVAPGDSYVLQNSDICSKLADKNLSQQEKDSIFDKYMTDLYINDRFARFPEEVHKMVDKELGKDASKEERQQRLGELAYKEAPWNKIKLDDTTKSKDAFAKRQKVMRQWFPDDSRYLQGPTTEKLSAKKFYEVLNNGEYNGLVRSMKNSPEYTALLNSLKEYTNETDIAKDSKNFKAVKDACEKYLEHYENKDEKRKSEFAKMRRDKVKELLDSLGGPSKEESKEAVKSADAKKKVGSKTNIKELEGKENSKNAAKQTKKQDKKVEKRKTTSKTK